MTKYGPRATYGDCGSSSFLEIRDIILSNISPIGMNESIHIKRCLASKVDVRVDITDVMGFAVIIPCH